MHVIVDIHRVLCGAQGPFVRALSIPDYRDGLQEMFQPPEILGRVC